MLGRLGEGMGLYLAATGHALPAPEALHAGLVTHVLESHVSLRMLCDSLGALSEGRRFDHAVQTVDELAVQVRGKALLETFPSEFLRMSSGRDRPVAGSAVGCSRRRRLRLHTAVTSGAGELRHGGIARGAAS